MECRVRRVEKQKEINKCLLKEAVRTVPQLQDCRRHVETATFLSHHIVSSFISALTPSLLIYVSLSFSSLSLPLLMFYQGVIIHLVYLWLEKIQAAAVHVVYIIVEYCLMVAELPFIVYWWSIKYTQKEGFYPMECLLCYSSCLLHSLLIPSCQIF